MEKVRLFYTDFSGTHYGKQTLTTAQVNLSQPDSDTIKVDGVEDHKSIFDGDSKTYQNVQQFIDEGNYSSGDNHTLRDPHYVEDNGHKYLVFLKLIQEQKMVTKEMNLYLIKLIMAEVKSFFPTRKK
ncbi:hypothetical protein GCM10020331_006690 [Ectobacillus funiculus]